MIGNDPLGIYVFDRPDKKTSHSRSFPQVVLVHFSPQRQASRKIYLNSF